MDNIIGLVEKNTLFSQRRIPSLYSDFKRLRETNEEGYHANVAAWKSVLNAAIRDGYFPDRTCMYASEGLVSALTSPDSGRPLALDAVFEEMVKTGEVIPLGQFLTQAHSIDGRNWGLRPVLSWALNKSGLWDTSWHAGGSTVGTLRDMRYVVVSELTKLADRLVLRIKNQLAVNSSSYTHSVYTRAMFYELLTEEEPGISQVDCDCITRYLSRDRQLLAADSDTIKLCLNRPLSPVSEQDKAVANLRSTINDISKRVDGLSARIKQCTQRAQTALQDKNRVLAKYAIQSRKMAQETQAKSLDMLTNLEHVLTQIDSSSGHLETVNALKSGVDILGNLNKAVGGAEKVGDLMDQLRDQTEETDAIGNEISQLTNTVIDEDDIDLELEQLVQQETESQLKNLPSAPSQQPQQEDDQVNELVNNTQNLSLQETEQKEQPNPLPS
ncbi:hypothetical protein TRICI_003099 [Trichomonascus ciferrii]|uniref:Charged multivesicular body protein 7 n=1 Tax=Trichomonascus ciferrii TaxID=44093 RepID=A0A642V4U7_9ASCO|nr:hypothetical protein TRICI_003099 [Trichomonascus ciferrii]